MTTTIRLAVSRTVYTRPEQSVEEPMGSISFEVLGGKTGIKITFKSNGTKGFKVSGETVLSFGKATQENIEEYLVKLWSQFGNDMIRSTGGDQATQQLFHDTFFKSWQSENTKMWRNLFLSVFRLDPEERIRYRKTFSYDITLKENLALSVDMPEESEAAKPTTTERRKEKRAPISDERRELSRAISKSDASDMKTVLDLLSKSGADRAEAVKQMERGAWKSGDAKKALDIAKKEMIKWIEGKETRENVNRLSDDEVTNLLKKWNR